MQGSAAPLHATGVAVTFSKRRYGELEAALRAELTEEVAVQVLEVVKRVLNFDPSASSFTEARAHAMRQWRARKAAEARERGVPAYELTGAKGARERARQVAAESRVGE